MAEKLKKIERDPKCGFMVRSHDEKKSSRLPRSMQKSRTT